MLKQTSLYYLTILSQWKKLVLIVSIIFDTIMTLLWTLSSALLMEIYWEYCEIMEDNGSECGGKDQRFVSIPVLGFICAAGWVGHSISFSS